ncbi:MAG: helix-hairpin-helix domain-containing protein [Promethearchaeota archaeon]
MEKNNQIIAIVRSPSKDHHQLKGSGFSLSEIKKAGKSIEEIKKLKIKIDYFRKSIHNDNVEKLKNLKKLPGKEKPKKPFVQKEKKRTEFKPKSTKVKKTTPKKAKPTPKKIIKKAKIIPKEKPLEQQLEVIKKPKEKVKGIPLTELTGLGPTTSDKFIELGVNSIEDLLQEDATELATLIKGVSEERIIKWIEEAKEILNK